MGSFSEILNGLPSDRELAEHVEEVVDETINYGNAEGEANYDFKEEQAEPLVREISAILKKYGVTEFLFLMPIRNFATINYCKITSIAAAKVIKVFFSSSPEARAVYDLLNMQAELNIDNKIEMDPDA